MDADNLLFLAERKLSWMTKIDNEWLEVEVKKISGGRSIYWSTALRVAVVLTVAKDALQVWAPLDDKLVKLGKLKEQIREIRILRDEVYGIWPEQNQSFRLVNVAEVRQLRALKK